MSNGQPFYTYHNAGYTPHQAQFYSYQPQPQMQYMAQNQPLNGFQQQGQINAQPQAQQPVMPTKTNVPLVTSLSEAMSRTGELNSDTVYADQDEPFIYRVSIDMQGRKTYRTFQLVDVTEQEVKKESKTDFSNIDLSNYATKQDLQAFRDEIMGYAMSMGLSTSTPIPPKPKKIEKVEKIDKAPIKAESENIDTNKE